jgi:hypothetical protein
MAHITVLSSRAISRSDGPQNPYDSASSTSGDQLQLLLIPYYILSRRIEYCWTALGTCSMACDAITPMAPGPRPRYFLHILHLQPRTRRESHTV